MTDLTRLLDSSDCTGHGCPNEADGPDGLCRYCRANGPRLEPTPVGPGALAHLIDQEDEPAMPTPPPVPLPKPPAPDPDVVTCRKCSRPATHLAKRGLYSRLCDQHYDEARARQAARSSKIPASVKAPSPAPRPTPPPGGTTTTGPTRVAEAGTSLVQLAQRVEDARTDLDLAIDNLRQAVEELAA